MSTPSVVLTGYPPRQGTPLSWPGGGGTLPRYPPWQGTPQQGTPGRVPPSRVPPRLDLAGYPPGWTWQGAPQVSAPWHSGKCYKALWDMGIPPRCEQTNKVKLLPSRRTTYAGGNNDEDQYLLLFEWNNSKLWQLGRPEFIFLRSLLLICEMICVRWIKWYLLSPCRSPSLSSCKRTLNDDNISIKIKFFIYLRIETNTFQLWKLRFWNQHNFIRSLEKEENLRTKCETRLVHPQQCKVHCRWWRTPFVQPEVVQSQKHLPLHLLHLPLHWSNSQLYLCSENHQW